MDENDPKPMKVILIGSVGVGKTSLVNRFLYDKYDMEVIHTMTPAFFSTKVVLQDGMNVELQIWDTAGQEKYLGISEMFYRDSDVALLCYDWENRSTIEEWKDRVRIKAPDCLFFLVLTKCDILVPEQMIEATAQIEEMSQKINARHHSITSANSGVGVSDLFCATGQIAKEISRPRPAGVDFRLAVQKRKKCC
jgi:small GTP-binding protein